MWTAQCSSSFHRVFACANRHVGNNRFNHRVIFSHHFGHPFLDDICYRVSDSLIRSDRHPDVCVDEVRVALREKYDRGFSDSCKYDRENKEEYHTNSDPYRAIPLYAPRYQVLVTGLYTRPNIGLESRDNASNKEMM